MSASSPRWHLLRLLARVSPGYSAVLGALLALAALLPVGLAISVGLLVGTIPDAARDGTVSAAYHRSLLVLLVVGILFLVQQSLPPFQEAVAEALGVRVMSRLGERVMRAALEPAGIAHLEDPGMLDRIARAQRFAPTDYAPLYAVPALAGIIAITIAAIASAALLFGFHWWAPLLVLAARFWSRVVARRQLFRTSEVASGLTQALRRSNYLRSLATTPDAAKELRVFGLAGWLSGKATAAWTGAMGDVWRRRGGGGRVLASVILPPLVADVVVLATLTSTVLGGGVSIGRFTTFVQALLGVAALSTVSTQDIYAEYGARPVTAALELEAATRRLPPMSGSEPNAGRPTREIRLERVGFHYPGQSRAVLDDLDLTIPAGRSLGIVGVNGAGKTTLVKLLARLYAPSSGRIWIDGTELADIEPTSWQRSVAGIFQDFVHYDLSIAENITLGAPQLAGDRELLVETAGRAGVTPIVERLPHGWDTVLNRLHSKGAEISGGEWQRVGIARALFAVAGGARVLVLDEPTANLDVRAEADLYDRFLELTSGITTILISHRFSTVRRAERICVLEDGRISEQGTHQELLAGGGRYAEMFRLQASLFDSASERA